MKPQDERPKYIEPPCQRQRIPPKLRIALMLTTLMFATSCQRSQDLTPRQNDPPASNKDSGPVEPVEDTQPWLRDMTPQSQIHFAYQNGQEADQFTILESVGGGVALFDFDKDGRLDIFVPGGGQFADGNEILTRGLPGKLYRNLGDWRFADVTEDAGLAAAPFYSHGCLVGDYDNDGWPDLLITGYGGMTLYHNQPGLEQGGSDHGRRFIDATMQMGLADSRWCTSAAWGDLLGNGQSDLYVCRYLDWSESNNPECHRGDDPTKRDVCPPQRFAALPDSIYRHDGDTYTDVSDQFGLAMGKAMGVLLADVDGDSRPDVYVANDDGNNHLYLNHGGRNPRITECGLLAGVAVDDNGRYNGSMGLDIGDFDGSGLGSLLVTNYQGELPALYANLGRGEFLHQSRVAGLGALGQGFVGFGVSFIDLDNDSWLDLAIVNGHVLRYPIGTSFLQRPLLFQNVERSGRRFFREISSRGGPYFSKPVLGRGLAVGDLDNDGWLDMVLSPSNSELTLLRNVAQESTVAHWLGIELVGRDNRPVAGAVIRLQVAGRQLTRFAKSGGSYLSSSDPRFVFGLGQEDRVEKLTVQWPWGTLQEWDASQLMIDRYWQLQEDSPLPREARAPR